LAEQKVILIDEHDKVIGSMEKMEAHQKGVLHRAFSVFIFNSQGEMLLQKRAAGKYHSAGLWTNACCSHPGPGEKTEDAARRRLREEMGFETPLEKIFDFIYKSSFKNGLIEYEFDHVFAGQYEDEIHPDPVEVSEYSFRDVLAIKRWLSVDPGQFTAWFQIAFPQVETWWMKKFDRGA
jgi:isopentenyl-diphosphate Delta-isomerase